MSDAIRMLTVARKPTAADNANCDLIVDGVPEDYPGWMIEPGVLWHDTVHDAVFVCVDAVGGVWTPLTF